MKLKILVCLMMLVFGIIPPEAGGQDYYWFRKGLRAKDPARKIEYFSKSIETEGENAETYVSRGDVYWDLAIDAVYNYHPVVIVFDKDKADFHNSKLMYDKAREDYTKAMAMDPGCAKAYIKRSDVYWQLGQKENALADLSLLIAMAPDNAEAYVKRAGLYRNDFRDFEKSLSDASRAIGIDPGYAAAYHVRGYNYYQLRQYEEAMADYNKCLEIDPNDAYAWLRRGDIFRLTGYYEKAISDYCRAIEIDRKMPLAYNNRGMVYLIQSDYDRSVADFRRAISLDPSGLPFSFNNAGYAYLQMEQTDRAIEYFHKCLATDKDFYAASLNLALVYYGTGDKEKTRFYLEQSKTTAPFLVEEADGFARMSQDWYYWTEKDKETLKMMIQELK